MSPGDQLIDLVYIDDVVNAFLTAAARPGAGEAPFETFSISSGNPRTLRDVVRLWSSITGRALNLQWGARPHRPREMLTSWSGGAPLPGWRSSIPLEDGISLMEERGEAP
jgi:nucleoside-diphosphate-sugar epimerase